MLTFEVESSDYKTLYIHGDPSRLRQLADELIALAKKVETSGNDHIHLMTEDWGGFGISSSAQSSTSELFHHVKIFCWEKLEPDAD